MKDKKSIASAALLENHPGGWVILTFVDHDGGEFNLVPKADDGSLYLADVNLPKYLLQIRGASPGALKRVANGLLAIARAQESAGGDEVDETDEA